MKSKILAISTVLAALAALAVLPVSAIAEGGNTFLVIGILAIFLADCGRTIKPLNVSTPVIAFDSDKRTRTGLGAAA